MTPEEQKAAHDRTLATYCQNCGALPGEKCATRTGRPCQRRKQLAREIERDTAMRGVGRTPPRAD